MKQQCYWRLTKQPIPSVEQANLTIFLSKAYDNCSQIRWDYVFYVIIGGIFFIIYSYNWKLSSNYNHRFYNEKIHRIKEKEGI